MSMEPFVVRHYEYDGSPTIKGNGFDGLEIGDSREEAEEFIACVNKLIAACQGINTFYTFFESNIPPNMGKGAREALQAVNAALRLDRKS